MVMGEPDQSRMPEQLRLLDRRIGHQRNLAFGQPRQQVPFRTAPRKVVEDLVGGQRTPGRNRPPFAHVIDVEVGDAEVADLAGGLQCLEAGDGVGKRHVAAPMQQVQVDPVGAQAFQAALAGRHQARARSVVRVHLADDEGFIAAPGQRLAHQLFGGAFAVHLRGVDQPQPQIQTLAQGCDFLGTGGAAVADMPGALPERGHHFSGGKADGFHGAWRCGEPPYDCQWWAWRVRMGCARGC